MIAFTGVSKTYGLPGGRRVRAVEEFSLEIAAGEVLGLAGPNGAGKSTLIALLLGYLRPSAGRVTIDGLSPRRYIEREGVSYMSELVAIPPRWTVDAALARYAVLAGVAAADIPARVDSLIHGLGLGEHRRKRVRALSKGNLQRLGLAQALLREERVIVLDEPTHGLDPVWTQRFRALVESLRRPERAVLIASHNLDELERLADRVAIIDRGRLQRVVPTARAGSAAIASSYRLAVAGGDGAVVPEIFAGAQATGEGVYLVPAGDLAVLNAGLAALLARGVLLTEVAPAYSVLERHFRDVVQGSAEGA